MALINIINVMLATWQAECVFKNALTVRQLTECKSHTIWTTDNRKYRAEWTLRQYRLETDGMTQPSTTLRRWICESQTPRTRGHCSPELNWHNHGLMRQMWCGLHTGPQTYAGTNFIKQTLNARLRCARLRRADTAVRSCWCNHGLTWQTWCGLHTGPQTYVGTNFIKQMLDARSRRMCMATDLTWLYDDHVTQRTWTNHVWRKSRGVVINSQRCNMPKKNGNSDDAGWYRHNWRSRERKSRMISNPLVKMAKMVLLVWKKYEYSGWTLTTAARMNQRWVKPELVPCTSSSMPDRNRVREFRTVCLHSMLLHLTPCISYH